MDTLTDIRLTEDRDVAFDDTGDIAVVSGQDNVNQQIGMDVLDITHDTVGDALTATNIERLRSAIQTALDEDEQVDDVHGVSVKSIGDNDQSISFDVRVSPDTSFTLTL